MPRDLFEGLNVSVKRAPRDLLSGKISSTPKIDQEEKPISLIDRARKLEPAMKEAASIGIPPLALLKRPDLFFTPKAASKWLGVPEGMTPGQEFQDLYAYGRRGDTNAPIEERFANEALTGIAGDVMDFATSPVSYTIGPILKGLNIAAKPLIERIGRLPFGKSTVGRVFTSPLEDVSTRFRGEAPSVPKVEVNRPRYGTPEFDEAMRLRGAGSVADQPQVRGFLEPPGGLTPEQRMQTFGLPERPIVKNVEKPIASKKLKNYTLEQLPDGTFRRVYPDGRIEKQPSVPLPKVEKPIPAKEAEYKGLHESPDIESGAPLHNLKNIYPEDIYGPKGAQYYGHYGQNDPNDVHSVSIIRSFRNKPDRLVRIYRAVPKDVKEINRGDWVSINRLYAKEHGESTLKGDYKVISKVVHARDIFTNGDSIHEWGYDPQPFVPMKERPIEQQPGWYKKKLMEKPQPKEITKQPWEMTAKEWDYEFEKGRPSSSGSHQITAAANIGKSVKGAEKSLSDLMARQEFLKMGIKDIPLVDKQGQYGTRPARHFDVIQKALSEGKQVPSEVLKDYPELLKQPSVPKVKTVIETDATKVQEIKNSIAEGEMILKSGKTSVGRKMSEAELENVRRSVEKSKAKIGIVELSKPKTIKPRKPSVIDTSKAVQLGDKASLIKAHGGISSKSEFFKNFEPEERKKFFPFMRKSGIEPDSLLTELKGKYPHLFKQNTGYELLNDIISGKIYDKVDINSLEKEIATKEAEYNAKLAEAEKHPEIKKSDIERIKADAQRELEAERTAIQSEESAGEVTPIEVTKAGVQQLIPGTERTLPPTKITPKKPQKEIDLMGQKESAAKEAQKKQGDFLKGGGSSSIQGLAEPEINPETESAEELRAKMWQVDLPKEPTIKETINKTQIINFVEKAFKVPVRGKLTHTMVKLMGFYKRKSQIIRLKTWGELEVLAHELAHHIDNILKKSLEIRWRAGLPGEKLIIKNELASMDYKPEERRTSEGFAEFMRHYLTNTGLDSRLAPTFHKYFFGTFLKGQPELAKNLDKLHSLYTIWQKQGALNRTLGHIDQKAEHSKKPLGDMIRNKFDNFQRLWIDEFYPIKQVMEALGVKSRINIKPTSDPYEMATYMKQKASGVARTFVEEAAIDEFGNKVGPSLKEIMKPIPAEKMKEFMAYWVSRRALHLEKTRGKQSGFDVNDSEYIIQKYQSPEWDKIAIDLNKWSEQAMDWMIRSGGLSEQTAELFRVLNPIYVPFKRAFSEELNVVKGVGKLFTESTGIKAIKGSGRPIINPFESMIRELPKLFATAHKINLARLIANLADREGAGNFISDIPLATSPIKAKMEDVLNNLKTMLGIHPGGFVESGVSDELLDAVSLLETQELDEFMMLFQKQAKTSAKNNTVAVFRNGKLKLYELHPQLYQALQGVEPIQLGAVLKILSPFTRLLRLGATGLNATFGLIRNPVRDFITATLFSKNKYTPLSPIKGVVKEFTAKPGDPAWKFKAVGGDISSQMGYDRAQTMAYYDEQLVKSKSFSGKVLKVVDPRNWIDVMRKIVNVPEMGPRIAELEKSLQKYKKEHPEWSDDDVWVAAFNDAQDITVNFSRSGKYGKQVNQAVFAFNASVQGLNKFYRAAKENPFKVIVAGLTTISLPFIASWYYNKDKEWYKNLDPQYRYSNLFFEVADGTVVRLPIPYDVGLIFGSLPGATLDTLYQKDPGLFEGLINIAISQIPNPLKISAFEPYLQIKQNKDYLGNPIEKKSMETLPSEYRSNPETPGYAIHLSRAFNTMGVELSPIQIEYLINAYTGGVLKTIPRTEIKEPSDIPIIGRQIQRFPERPSYQLNKFYDEKEMLSGKKKAGIATGKEQARLKLLDQLNRDFMSASWKRIKTFQEKDNRNGIRSEYKNQARILHSIGY